MRRKGPWNFPQKAQRTYSDDSQAHPQPHDTPRRREEASSCRARERSCTTVPQHYNNPRIAIGSRETFTEGAEERWIYMMVASMCNSKFIPQIPTACLSVLDYHEEQCNTMFEGSGNLTYKLFNYFKQCWLQKVNREAYTPCIHHPLSHSTAGRHAHFTPHWCGILAWCDLPMAHTWPWALQSFPSCCMASMGRSGGTCLWQAPAFTLTLASRGRLPGSQVTYANAHFPWHRVHTHTLWQSKSTNPRGT